MPRRPRGLPVRLSATACIAPILAALIGAPSNASEVVPSMSNKVVGWGTVTYASEGELLLVHLATDIDATRGYDPANRDYAFATATAESATYDNTLRTMTATDVDFVEAGFLVSDGAQVQEGPGGTLAFGTIIAISTTNTPNDTLTFADELTDFDGFLDDGVEISARGAGSARLAQNISIPDCADEVGRLRSLAIRLDPTTATASLELELIEQAIQTAEIGPFRIQFSIVQGECLQIPETGARFPLATGVRLLQFKE